MISSPSVEALRAHSLSQSVTANNIANMNTDEYKAKRLDLETGPEGRGVQPAAVREDTSPGPLIQRQETVENQQGHMEQQPALVEGSNTDLVQEFTTMIRDQQAIAANASVIGTDQDLAGMVIDMFV